MRGGLHTVLMDTLIALAICHWNTDRTIASALQTLRLSINALQFHRFAVFCRSSFCSIGGRWKSVQRRNVILLVASYVFYGWWDPRFLALIAFSTLVDYFVGIGLDQTMDPRRRKYLLWTSLVLNLGLLGYFKYTNFFLESFVDAFSLFGADLQVSRLNIILPVGISFYTFQTLSYSIDVYKRKLKASHDVIAFSTYVSFFPQLVAGPIERATNLLPQFKELRSFHYPQAIDGSRQYFGVVQKNGSRTIVLWRSITFSRIIPTAAEPHYCLGSSGSPCSCMEISVGIVILRSAVPGYLVSN